MLFAFRLFPTTLVTTAQGWDVDLTVYSSSGWHRLLTRLGHNFNREEISVLDSHPAEIKTAFALCRIVPTEFAPVKGKPIFPSC
jgi:hypothetical protein